MQKFKLLVVEDDPNLGTILAEYLTAKNYEVTLCVDGQEGFESFMKVEYDLVISDIMMPKKDGFTMASEVRKINNEIPIIFLTAKSMKEDTIEGFRIGADDYVTKPFSMEELLLRIGAILRRTKSDLFNEQNNKDIIIGAFTFNSNERTLKHDDIVVKLTSKEVSY